MAVDKRGGDDCEVAGRTVMEEKSEKRKVKNPIVKGRTKSEEQRVKNEEQRVKNEESMC